MRRKTGKRRWVASFWEHNGSADALNAPTYDNDADWAPVITGWYCEKLGVSGGETVRGRQISAGATSVLFGEYFGGVGVKPEHRAKIDGEDDWYEVVSSLDADGLQTELRVELKQSQ